jgi:hypothetical protein
MSSRKWLRVHREENGQVFSIRLCQPSIMRSISSCLSSEVPSGRQVNQRAWRTSSDANRVHTAQVAYRVIARNASMT